LDAVDRYWDLMEDNFPSAKEIDPGEYTIHIHDNPGAFWVGTHDRGCWCHGWCIGHHIVIAWAWTYDLQGRPNGLADKDPLMPLPHEWLHVVFSWERFWGDPGHIFFQECQETLDVISTLSPTVFLSEESILAAREFRYIPWACEGGPDE
jgi:hypothetical protein